MGGTLCFALLCLSFPPFLVQSLSPLLLGDEPPGVTVSIPHPVAPPHPQSVDATGLLYCVVLFAGHHAASVHTSCLPLSLGLFCFVCLRCLLSCWLPLQSALCRSTFLPPQHVGFVCFYCVFVITASFCGLHVLCVPTTVTPFVATVSNGCHTHTHTVPILLLWSSPHAPCHVLCFVCEHIGVFVACWFIRGLVLCMKKI